MKKYLKDEHVGLVQLLIKNKIKLCVLLCIVYLIIMGVFAWINRGDDSLLESLYYVSQIISALFVVVGTAIAVIQYIFNSDTARRDADKQRNLEAAKMADEFRKNVIPLISDLSVAYCDEKFNKEIIDYLDGANLEHFNKEELDRLFPENGYIQYRVQLARNYLVQTDEEFTKLENEYRNNTKLTKRDKDKIAEKLNDMILDSLVKVSQISTELSNSLEYMCICFNTNIADDKTVYQSLHQVFFKAVHMIYIFTFDANENEHDRLFYNVMVMYKKWKQINRQKEIEEVNNKVKLEEEMNSLKAMYNEKITIKTKCE